MNCRIKAVGSSETLTVIYRLVRRNIAEDLILHGSKSFNSSTVRSESSCALRLRYVDLVVSIEAAVEVCCCFTVFSC
jgi:hypothetical protein